MCRHGENIYNLSFVANRRISERRVLPSDNGKAQKPRFPTLFLGIMRQKSRTFLCGMLALHYNFDTRDDCSKQVQLADANRVQRMRVFATKLTGKNRGMHPHRVQTSLCRSEIGCMVGCRCTRSFCSFGQSVNYDGVS